MEFKTFFLLAIALTAIGCQFTETMVLEKDGSGIMSVEMDMGEMMALGGAAIADTLEMKIDTLINVKQFLEEKKDSIFTLSVEERQKLKKLENFTINLKIDTETSKMVYNISTKFKSVNEANDILNGLGQAGNFIPSNAATPEKDKQKDSPEIIGVSYSFEKNIFKRDAYIEDEKLHMQQMDSIQQVEPFLGSSYYTIKYTFSKKIAKISTVGATFSEDRKTVTVQKPFIEYFKNPDVLDLEIELEQ